MSRYELWREKATDDEDIVTELREMEDDETKIEDAFYRNLDFGTGGLRGVIGAGTNRMNIYTVAKASQGLADYINRLCDSADSCEPRIAVSYDSRIKSDLFAKVASQVFAANGIDVHIYKELMPTPCLSYAVRHLNCAAGVMITASHNPSKYNGYKVYGSDGCQITTETAAQILAYIEKADLFEDVPFGEFDHFLQTEKIKYIGEDVYTAFIENIKQQSLLGQGDTIRRDVAIVYTPLNGTGRKPVIRTLRETGFTNIKVVAEQEKPDGNFATCPYPNPEIREAMTLGMEYAEKYHADLLLATDPDCDRVGIAVKDASGQYVLLTGNQTGCLLLDYICSRRTANGTMPEDPVMIKTIVTTNLGEQIATSYGVDTINVLTGFKFIGEQIGYLEEKGRADSYIFGFEESYGYLSGSYVRDKDGVDAAFLICEMFAYYASDGISLLEKLDELYRKHGYCLDTQHSYEFDGSRGFQKMQRIMTTFRGDMVSFGGKHIKKSIDYAKGIGGLPKSNVLKFILEDNCSVVVRPSGTEPKLKVYISVSGEDKQRASEQERKLCNELERFIRQSSLKSPTP
jgi:phosphoglucomutase